MSEVRLLCGRSERRVGGAAGMVGGETGTPSKQVGDWADLCRVEGANPAVEVTLGNMNV